MNTFYIHFYSGLLTQPFYKMTKLSTDRTLSRFRVDFTFKKKKTIRNMIYGNIII